MPGGCGLEGSLFSLKELLQLSVNHFYIQFSVSLARVRALPQYLFVTRYPEGLAALEAVTTVCIFSYDKEECTYITYYVSGSELILLN